MDLSYACLYLPFADNAYLRSCMATFRAGIDDADNRHRQLFLEDVQGERRRGVAGDDEELYPPGKEEERAFKGILRDGLGRFVPVGQARRIAEVDDALMGKERPHLFQHREPADARIEHAYRKFPHGKRLWYSG